MDSHFTIESNPPPVLAGAPINHEVLEFMGPEANHEAGVPMLSLERALNLAVKQSRAYQSAKEQVYLSALALSLARHQFTPIFSGSDNTEYAELHDQVPSLNGRHVSSDGTLGVSWLLRDIGKVTAAATTDFLRYISGDPRSVISSQLGATFTRPLLRDANYQSEMETLTQAERNLLYALRTFVLYRKDFSVQIATTYYTVLGERDAIRNSFLNLQSSRKATERGRALAEEGRTTQSDLGRLEQQVLSAEATWISAVRTYKSALDSFKIQLGLPVATRLLLDDRELADLKILHPKINVEDCIRIALAARLDYQTTCDQSADAERKVRVAANQLQMQFDLVAGASMNSGSHGGFVTPKPSLYQWDVGANINLPFDRKLERNNYRAALITLDQTKRAQSLLADQIAQQVRDDYRALELAKRTFEISEIGVSLAARRVEEQDLLAELGRAKAQDQVDAQNDFINSKNQRTQALVSHTTARLQFWENLGILFIKDDGQWQEINEVKP